MVKIIFHTRKLTILNIIVTPELLEASTNKFKSTQEQEQFTNLRQDIPYLESITASISARGKGSNIVGTLPNHIVQNIEKFFLLSIQEGKQC